MPASEYEALASGSTPLAQERASKIARIVQHVGMLRPSTRLRIVICSAKHLLINVPHHTLSMYRTSAFFPGSESDAARSVGSIVSSASTSSKVLARQGMHISLVDGVFKSTSASPLLDRHAPDRRWIGVPCPEGPVKDAHVYIDAQLNKSSGR